MTIAQGQRRVLHVGQRMIDDQYRKQDVQQRSEQQAPHRRDRQDLDLSVSLFRIEVSDHRALMQKGRKLELHDGIDEDARTDRDVRHRVEGVLEREHEDDDGKRGKQTLAEGAEGREITRLDHITAVVQPVVIDRAVLVIMVDAEPAQDIYFRALFLFLSFFL